LETGSFDSLQTVSQIANDGSLETGSFDSLQTVSQIANDGSLETGAIVCWIHQNLSVEWVTLKT